MVYVVAEINFLGNDDAQIEGFLMRQVVSEEDWENQIKAAIERQIENNNGYLEISHSDNVATTFDDVEELFENIYMREITEVEYNAVIRALELDDEYPEYGTVPNFMEYIPPTLSKKAKP